MSKKVKKDIKKEIKKVSGNSHLLFVRLWLSILFLFLSGLSGQSLAQVPVPVPKLSPAPSNEAAQSGQSAEQQPAGIPVADIAVQAENALLSIQQLESENANTTINESTSDELLAMSRSVAIRSVEMRRLLIQTTSLDAIRDMERAWKELEQRATSITADLTKRAIELDKDLATLDKIGNKWTATQKEAQTEGAPAVVTDRVGDVLKAYAKAKKKMQQQRADLLAMQGDAANLSTRTSQARQALRTANERAAARLMYRDSPPVWSSAFWTSWIGDVVKGENADLPTHASILSSYAQYQKTAFAMHLGLFACLMLGLIFIRQKMRQQREQDICLKRATAILDMPVVCALLLALLASSWLYPRAPRIVWMIIGIVGIAPVVLLARRLMSSFFHPVLYALAGFYLADKIRTFLAVLPVLSRVWLIVELTFFLIFLIWTMRRLKARRKHRPTHRQTRFPAQRTIRVAGYLFGLLSLAALASALNGQVRLGGLIAGSVVISSYMGVVFYTVMRVAEGIIQALLSVPPASFLDMVKRKKEVLLHHLTQIVRWTAYIAWIAVTLQSLGLMQPFMEVFKGIWAKAIEIGTFNPTVGDIITFLLIIWATFILSRMTRFFLEEEAFPKLQLERGLPYAISTVVHYLILLTGFVLALTALKVDMTKFTILAGALSVGIGFGLQNIVNNFVSGLIVLFERPVKVGDTIQMGDMTGRVRHIGIRASVIASTTGAEVIIPNGKLISEQVTNWTLSSKLRQVMVTVVTKTTYDADEITQLLLDIASRHRLVVDKPAPEALFVKRTIDQAEYELHVWTAELDEWLSLKSDLMSEINKQLKLKETEHQDSDKSG